MSGFLVRMSSSSNSESVCPAASSGVIFALASLSTAHNPEVFHYFASRLYRYTASAAMAAISRSTWAGETK